MEFPDRHVWLEEGEFLIVPQAWSIARLPKRRSMSAFEPAGTLNTGDVREEDGSRAPADLRNGNAH